MKTVELIHSRYLILPVLECDRVEDVKNGKKIKLNTDEKRVILVHGCEILAAYEKKDDGLYHSVRGLF